VTRGRALVGAAVLAQLVLLLVVVAPRLSPRLRGEEVRLLVAPVDPIDPFRGAYVELAYERAGDIRDYDGERGDVHVPLVRDPRTDAYRLGRPQRERPASGPFLACSNDGSLSCGIESFFASEPEARRLGSDLRGRRSGIARVRIDGAGRGAIVGLEPARPR